ncbi:MAG: BON domain-containing protein [Gammaproteobacteria bacterium]|uniref:BON domain-containing protein n=1 Tax=Limnobacter sp. TaxID=2003368 RepID=UPI001DAD6CF0|nr:BON domain-containing protein [Limnobacter sp.]MBU0783116.1 BON domain-containing protein [Gammaproteobacteria bacterium]MBU0849703.1 BON domain-containing protein [Gammaproteobacteria bacterium]MBU1266154.1 BON domain-containing protein [Gammaproteobacteria bacterium]MBU1529345.1 BON domain-containing protein [Gammaproteobacteria bacterium]MBU1779276.1 BON domain-containing protein [Gammaproteobacteria bacterium]
MSKLIAQTLIAAGVAFSALAPAYAAEQLAQQQPDQQPGQQPKSSVGQYVDDSTITAKVKAKHAEDKVVSALRVSVETKQGVVVLSGEAKTDGEKQRAEMLAMQVEGVKSVSNKIEVKPKS